MQEMELVRGKVYSLEQTHMSLKAKYVTSNVLNVYIHASSNKLPVGTMRRLRGCTESWKRAVDRRSLLISEVLLIMLVLHSRSLQQSVMVQIASSVG